MAVNGSEKKDDVVTSIGEARGLVPRLVERIFDVFLSKGRRAMDDRRASLNFKLVLALVGTLAIAWRLIGTQQESYERLVNAMISNFSLQHKETIDALGKLEKAQTEMAKEQRSNTETMRAAFLADQDKKRR